MTNKTRFELKPNQSLFLSVKLCQVLIVAEEKEREKKDREKKKERNIEKHVFARRS